MKQSLDNLNRKRGGLVLSLILIFGEFVSCSFGTDKDTPLPGKPLNQFQFNTEGSFLKSENKVSSNEVIPTENSGTKATGHPNVDYNKSVSRQIFVPSEVEGKWKAVKILIQNKKDEKKEKTKILELGTSFIPEGSELKITMGPFLPNFIMDKTTYTSIGNRELNPAVHLVVEENGKIIYKGWVFKKFPLMYAFEHQVFSIKLLGGIPVIVS